MDSSAQASLITAFAAVLGSTVGGLATFATTMLNQRYLSRREMPVKDVANREQLYSEFLKEVANRYIESLDRNLDTPASFIGMYSLLGRIRMVSNEAVLKAAQNVVEDIIESYNRPPMTLQELHKLTHERRADPWHEFTNACRAERQSMLVKALQQRP